jgi:hypothetical protein
VALTRHSQVSSAVRHVMSKLNCPRCGSPSVSVWQKLGLGSLKKIKCKSCGAFITVPWFKSLLVISLGTLIQLFGGLLAFSAIPQQAGAIASFVGAVLGVVLGTLLSLWLYNRYVPLVVKHA